MHAGSLTRPSPWTRNVDGFLEGLSALHFSGGGGPNEAAIAGGLAEALVMFPKPTPTGTGTETETDQVQDHNARERHCILVAASNPVLFRTAVQIPIISNGQFSSGTQTRWTLADAQDVAKLYAECSVSLSVISPKQFPKLREIYNAVQITNTLFVLFLELN
ncbi:putative mediator complex, subunit Med25, von Willebrand factor type A [Rosa chinensis]|uniref:Mediator of RNA polymerase II transcription subunit 25 n=1 Tax=Rosa chinensis TaxID=74649 RepID=A0A2P6P3J4_ROSCH|nr:putative mediator complex, subunit Med25, von Willebrand factor type A [Rosa chinensis]